MQCRDEVRKAKANLELKLVRDMKGKRKVLYKFSSSKRNIGKMWVCY